MSNVIDWTKYGRTKPTPPAYEITYHGDSDRTWCTARFPLERYEEVKGRIEEQIQFWKDHP